MNFRLGNCAERCEKIEITSLIGLADVLGIQRAIATRITRNGLLPGFTPAADFIIRNMEMDASRRHVNLNLVTGLHKSQRPADKTFRRDMEYAGAITGPAHARIGNAQHVPNALFYQFSGDRQHAPFRHTGAALWSAILEHKDVVGRDVEIIAFDLAGHMVV